MNTAKEQISAVGKYLNKNLMGKVEQNQVLLTALVSGKNVYFVGAPGIGKSYGAELLSHCLGKAKLTQFARDTREEELFGPLDLTKLMPKDGSQTRYVRVAAENDITYVQDCDVFIMDEPANAPEGCLKRLHALLEERRVHDGEKWVDAKMQLAVATSNEMLPEECYALNDRFTLRYECKDLNAPQKMAFIKARAQGALPKPDAAQAPQLSESQVFELREEALAMPFDDMTFEVMSNIIAELETRHLAVSTRNWNNLLPVLQAYAMLCGDSEVKPRHLSFAKHVLWRSLDDKETVYSVIEDVVPDLEAELRAEAALMFDKVECVDWSIVRDYNRRDDEAVSACTEAITVYKLCAKMYAAASEKAQGDYSDILLTMNGYIEGMKCALALRGVKK